MYNLSTKAHEGPSSQRRPTQAHEEGKRPICMFFLVMVFFFKFTTYSRKHTKAHSNHRRPTKANAGPQQPMEAQRRPTKAHSTQRRPMKANTGPQQPTEGQRRPTKAHSTQRRPTQAHRSPRKANAGPQLGIGTGDPGVFQGYPYPYPRKPVPVFKGTGFTGYGYGFSPKITRLWNKNKIKNLYIKKQSKFSPDYGPNNVIGLLTSHVNNEDVRSPRLSRSLY